MAAYERLGPRITVGEFDTANQRGGTRRSTMPPAIRARWDAAGLRVVVTLASGMELALPPALIQGLAGASVADLREIEISPVGLALRFPRLDLDLDLLALLAGRLGTRSWMAGALARRLGTARSEARSRAARLNGQRRARPAPAESGQEPGP